MLLVKRNLQVRGTHLIDDIELQHAKNGLFCDILVIVATIL